MIIVFIIEVSSVRSRPIYISAMCKGGSVYRKLKDAVIRSDVPFGLYFCG
jgi:hypothetical protein